MAEIRQLHPSRSNSNPSAASINTKSPSLTTTSGSKQTNISSGNASKKNSSASINNNRQPGNSKDNAKGNTNAIDVADAVDCIGGENELLLASTVESIKKAQHQAQQERLLASSDSTTRTFIVHDDEEEEDGDDENGPSWKKSTAKKVDDRRRSPPNQHRHHHPKYLLENSKDDDDDDHDKDGTNKNPQATRNHERSTGGPEEEEELSFTEMLRKQQHKTRTVEPLLNRQLQQQPLEPKDAEREKKVMQKLMKEQPSSLGWALEQGCMATMAKKYHNNPQIQRSSTLTNEINQEDPQDSNVMNDESIHEGRHELLQQERLSQTQHFTKKEKEGDDIFQAQRQEEDEEGENNANDLVKADSLPVYYIDTSPHAQMKEEFRKQRLQKFLQFCGTKKQQRTLHRVSPTKGGGGGGGGGGGRAGLTSPNGEGLETMQPQTINTRFSQPPFIVDASGNALSINTWNGKPIGSLYGGPGGEEDLKTFDEKGVQVFIPMDRDGTIELMKQVQNETELELEEAEKSVMEISAERNRNLVFAKSVEQQLYQVSMEKRALELKNEELHVYIQQLESELQKKQKQEDLLLHLEGVAHSFDHQLRVFQAVSNSLSSSSSFSTFSSGGDFGCAPQQQKSSIVPSSNKRNSKTEDGPGFPSTAQQTPSSESQSKASALKPTAAGEQPITTSPLVESNSTTINNNNNNVSLTGSAKSVKFTEEVELGGGLNGGVSPVVAGGGGNECNNGWQRGGPMIKKSSSTSMGAKSSSTIPSVSERTAQELIATMSYFHQQLLDIEKRMTSHSIATATSIHPPEAAREKNNAAEQQQEKTQAALLAQQQGEALSILKMILASSAKNNNGNTHQHSHQQRLVKEEEQGGHPGRGKEGKYVSDGKGIEESKFITPSNTDAATSLSLQERRRYGNSDNNKHQEQKEHDDDHTKNENDGKQKSSAKVGGAGWELDISTGTSSREGQRHSAKKMSKQQKQQLLLKSASAVGGENKIALQGSTTSADNVHGRESSAAASNLTPMNLQILQGEDSYATSSLSTTCSSSVSTPCSSQISEGQ